MRDSRFNIQAEELLGSQWVVINVKMNKVQVAELGVARSRPVVCTSLLPNFATFVGISTCMPLDSEHRKDMLHIR